MSVKDSALVVPSGPTWNELRSIFPLLTGCRVVYASDDAPGFLLNEQKTELVLKLPPPKLRATATCNSDGSITFDFEVT